jgi:ABC-type transport system involved in cytochrome c biogenesis ATPase subunit
VIVVGNTDFVIQTRGLTRYFGKKAAVYELDLAVPRGSVFAFLGRNGAGKTTTIRMLLGLLEPTRGSAEILGHDSRAIPHQLRQRIAYLAEGHWLPRWMRVKFQSASFSRWNRRIFRSVANHFNLDPDRRAGDLSRGERAGLSLLFAAVGLPYLLAVAWAALDGKLGAPFYPGMAAPGVLDLLAGAMYFFAGMLVGQREARWYGSRILVLGIPLVASGLTWIVPEYWQAALVVLLGTAITATAAWGTFRAGGAAAPQPWISRAALGSMVFTGASIAAMLALAFVSDFLPESPQPGELSSWPFSPTWLPDGTIVRLQQGEDYVWRAVDLAGSNALHCGGSILRPEKSSFFSRRSLGIASKPRHGCRRPTTGYLAKSQS